ncbi:Ionotropic receptor 25 [Gryllus bimaculatus]|nr:Ionotropic receptor 25 [Gryllus bimaculatus]
MAQTWRILVALLAASVALKSEAVSPEPWRSTPASAEGLEWAVSTAESPVPAPQPVLGPDAAALFAQDFFYAQRLQVVALCACSKEGSRSSRRGPLQPCNARLHAGSLQLHVHDSEWVSWRVVALVCFLLAILLNTYYSASMVTALLLPPPRTVHGLDDPAAAATRRSHVHHAPARAAAVAVAAVEPVVQQLPPSGRPRPPPSPPRDAAAQRPRRRRPSGAAKQKLFFLA